jgi:hypothetical protein
MSALRNGKPVHRQKKKVGLGPWSRDIAPLLVPSTRRRLFLLSLVLSFAHSESEMTGSTAQHKHNTTTQQREGSCWNTPPQNAERRTQDAEHSTAVPLQQHYSSSVNGYPLLDTQHVQNRPVACSGGGNRSGL